MCACIFAYACTSAWKLDENTGTPAVGVIGNYELADMGDGNWTQVLCNYRNCI